MTFSSKAQWDECHAAKIAPLVVPYLQGKSLDIGSGQGKVWPSAIGIDNAEYGGRSITDIKSDATDLSIFADASVDAVFSSFMLHQMERANAVQAIREWTRVLKVGGYMVLYTPNCCDERLVESHKQTGGKDGNPLRERRRVAPKYGTEDGDPHGHWDTKKGDLNCLLDIESRCGWDLILDEYRDNGDEFGILVIARKRDDREWTEDHYWHRHPGAAERALVIRYGAIGDAIVAASILPHLKQQGYHVTFNTTPRCEEVLRHDPNIDEWMIQATDFVPNELLGPYWAALHERYDRIINLSESVEGSLLTLPGRLNHGYADATRRKLCGTVNYLERTHDIADVPYDFRGSRFYPTTEERDWAQVIRAGNGLTRNRKDVPVIVWVVNGSSVHKVYPFVHVVCKWILERTPCHIYLYGDPGVGKELANGIIECLKEDGSDTKRIINTAGKWSLRQSLTFANIVDCIVGPETGPPNAMAMEAVPKVLYLSHSSAENLTKHWVNTTTLLPDAAKAPCWPCHRLHYDWTHCFRSEETAAALCASSIKPEQVFAAIMQALGAEMTPRLHHPPAPHHRKRKSAK